MPLEFSSAILTAPKRRVISVAVNPDCGLSGTNNKTRIIMTNVSRWMSWEGGIDLVAVTSPDLQMPNLIVHLGRMVALKINGQPITIIVPPVGITGGPASVVSPNGVYAR
jgi:hypothetical protein